MNSSDSSLPKPYAWAWETPTNRGLTWTPCAPPDADGAKVIPLYAAPVSPAPSDGIAEALREAQDILQCAYLPTDDPAGIDPPFGKRVRAVLAKIDSILSGKGPAPAVGDKLVKALEPFINFAERNTDENGWAGTRCEMERIVDWFGPSDFYALRSALSCEGIGDDKARLDFLEAESLTLACKSYSNGDADVGFEVISYHMAKPRERTIGQGPTPRKAIDEARAALSRIPARGEGR